MKRFCSRGCCLRAACIAKSLRGDKEFESNVLAKVGRTGNPDECWLWQGSIEQKNGYGRYKHKGKYLKAHRLVYEFCVGPIPEGEVVRHSCDNPPCTNPKHLLVGTVQDNVDDMMERGRYAWEGAFKGGEENPMSKLTMEQAIEMRRLYSQDKSTRPSQAKLAVMFGLTQAAVNRVVRNLAYKEE